MNNLLTNRLLSFSFAILVFGISNFAFSSSDMRWSGENSFSDALNRYESSPMDWDFSIYNATSEVQLLHIESDPKSGFIDIKILLDSESNLVGLVYTDDTRKREEFMVSQLAGGVVLERKSGYDIAKLFSRQFNPVQGGRLELEFLINALTGSKGRFNMELVRSGNQWVLAVKEGNKLRAFNQMTLKINYFFGQQVGIKEVIAKK